MRFEVLFTSCLFIPMLVSASTCTAGYCKNGGTCVLSRGSASCSCPANVTGATCEQDVDECVVLVSPCKNGGTCSNTMGSYGCRCISGWDGFDCAVNIDDCASSDGFPKCDNGGTCVDRVGTFFCSCISNYTGLTCQHENQCETLKPCHGNAQCRIDLFGRYSCNCSAGWTGQNCSIDIDECGVAASSGVPLCHHGATCSNTPGSFSCNCVPGYTGLTCQHENQCETLKPCHGGAQCRIDLFGRYSCSCSAGWTGQNCSIDIDECGVAASSGVPLCHHGATCANTPGSFSCNCVPGYTGQRCESAIDECSSNPCQNGGTCEDYPNRFACFCKPGWTGLLCQQEINERDNGSSQNGGQSSMKKSVFCVVVRCIIFSILLAFCEFVELISL